MADSTPSASPSGSEGLVRALVADHRIGEAILPVQQVADHDVEAREANGVALLFEQRARAFGGRERLVIAAEQQQRLDAGAQRAGELGWSPTRSNAAIACV